MDYHHSAADPAIISPLEWLVRWWIALQDDQTIIQLTYQDAGKVDGIPNIPGI